LLFNDLGAETKRKVTSRRMDVATATGIDASLSCIALARPCWVWWKTTDWHKFEKISPSDVARGHLLVSGLGRSGWWCDGDVCQGIRKGERHDMQVHPCTGTEASAQKTDPALTNHRHQTLQHVSLHDIAPLRPSLSSQCSCDRFLYLMLLSCLSYEAPLAHLDTRTVLVTVQWNDSLHVHITRLI
jgi:hypothetical protein